MSVVSLVTRSRLDALHDAWERAETYGRPTLERQIFGDRVYRATISCDTPTGSRFYAHGEGDTTTAAMNAAIDEAELMATAYRNLRA